MSRPSWDPDSAAYSNDDPTWGEPRPCSLHEEPGPDCLCLGIIDAEGRELHDIMCPRHEAGNCPTCLEGNR